MSKVDVVLPFRNCAGYLSETLESIRRQTFRDWRVWMLDHGSTDNSRGLADKVAESDARFSIVDGRSCQTLSDLRNLGISKSDCELVIFSDADDISLPNRFERLIAAHEAYSTAVVIGSNASVIDFHGRTVGKMTVPQHPDAARAQLFFRTPVFQPAASLKRREFGRLSASFGRVFVGQGDPDFNNPPRIVAEDYLLYAQLGLVADVRNIQEELVAYRWHPANMSSQKRSAQLQNAARISMLVELLSWQLWGAPRFRADLFSNHGNRLAQVPEGVNLNEEFKALREALFARLGASHHVQREVDFRSILVRRSRLAMARDFIGYSTKWGWRDDQLKTVGAFCLGRVA